MSTSSLDDGSLQLVVACAWLGLLLLLSVGYLLLQIRRSPYTLWENVLYLPTYLFGRLLWRVHFANDPPAAIRTGAVLVANHRSSVDPFFVQLSARRRVHWMVAREYVENAVFGPLLRTLQVIPTNRSGMDTKATKQAIRLAKEGRLVGMFPEGRLNHTPRDPLVSIRPGAALVALRAGVPVIPLHILGSPYRREVWSPIFMPARVKITFGEPIDPLAFAEQNAAVPTGDTSSEDLSAVAGSEETPAPDAEPRTDSVAAADMPTPPAGVDENRRRAELRMAERVMLQWGKQIATIAGRPDWKVEIAGRSRLTNTMKVNT